MFIGKYFVNQRNLNALKTLLLTKNMKVRASDTPLNYFFKK